MRTKNYDAETGAFAPTESISEKAKTLLTHGSSEDLVIILVKEAGRFLEAAGFIDIERLDPAGSKYFLNSALDEDDPDDPGVSIDLKGLLGPAIKLAEVTRRQRINKQILSTKKEGDASKIIFELGRAIWDSGSDDFKTQV